MASMSPPSKTPPSETLRSTAAKRLHEGIVIPATPLALNAQRILDERRQRGLIRYYVASGAGGIAVGVHTTQFAIRHPEHGLFKPVLQLVSEELDRAASIGSDLVRIAGACGETGQAVAEAMLAKDLGYDAVLLSLSAFRGRSEHDCLTHCAEVSKVMPMIGFYLQPSVGGRILSYDFWRKLAELKGLVAIKIAPFNRYQTLDVVRAIFDSGRDDIALYTGNDDNILSDLLTPFQFDADSNRQPLRIVGGLLGQWAVWTSKAVELHQKARTIGLSDPTLPIEWLKWNAMWTDANAAIFDAANGFAGCIAGIHEVLRRQRIFEGFGVLIPRKGSAQVSLKKSIACAKPTHGLPMMRS